MYHAFTRKLRHVAYLRLCGAALLFLLPVSAVHAQDTPDAQYWYLTLEAGGSRSELASDGLNLLGGFENTGDDRDFAGLLGLNVGRAFGNWRVDAGLTVRDTYDFRTNSFPGVPPILFFYKTKVRAHTLMLNVWADFPTGTKWTPFIGAGVGGTRVTVKTDDTVVFASDTDTNAAFQGSAGVSYELSSSSSLEVVYRYVDMGETEVRLTIGGLPAAGDVGDYDVDLNAHELYVGYRWRF